MTSRGIYAVRTAPGQKIGLGHHGCSGGRGSWEGKVPDELLGLATAVEMVRVGAGSSEFCGRADTSPSPRNAAPRSVAQLILDALLGLRGERRERKKQLGDSFTGHVLYTRVGAPTSTVQLLLM